ncbi:MAG: hypothetical protein HKP48_03055 [Winogradskyella sp.]|uniref:hypothetical protein n=1 Tax=Winogradskyella sp. TaxID=1883156 RepID=UPI0018465DE6|nr:hypothetical protein [Winogradskyella sp.]MBT8243881.1 hypothetical protein [Winogradskyella sp.]NNK22286.1 hypothetical protein [Winogradskyella sp.]
MNISKLFDLFNQDPKEEEQSLEDIVPILKNKLVKAHQDKEVVIFKIIRAKKTGFLVKVKGIYAFVPFSLMAWDYQLMSWKVMERELIGYKFFAQIIEIDLTKNRIILDAKVTEFNDFKLIDGHTYKCIILSKHKDYIIVELGHRFQWKYGSQCYMVRLDSPNYTEIDYSIHSISDEINLTYVNSAHNWKKISFSKKQVKTHTFKTAKEEEKNIQDKTQELISKNEKLKASLLKKNDKYKKLRNDYKNLVEHRKEEKQKIISLQEKYKKQSSLIYFLENKIDELNVKSERLKSQLQNELNSNTSQKTKQIEKELLNLENNVSKLHFQNQKLTKQLEDAKDIISTQETLIYYLKNGANNENI